MPQSNKATMRRNVEFFTAPMMQPGGVLVEAEMAGLERDGLWEGFGGPGRDRTDDPFHAMECKWQPEIDSKAVNNRSIGQNRVYRAIFPANFRPNFQCAK